jgi:hypothetical protein
MGQLRNFNNELNTAFGVAAPQEIEAPAEIVAATPPDDGLPFRIIPIPETNLKYAQSKETGGIDWTGTAIANGESEVAQKIVGLAADFVKGLGKAAGINAKGHVIPAAEPAQLHGHHGSSPNGSSGLGNANGGWTQG